MVSRTAIVLLMGLFGVLFLATQLPPPHGTALPDDPPITSPRIRLSDGRLLAYKEQGVPKNKSNYKIIIIHGFGSSKDMNFLAPQVNIYTYSKKCSDCVPTIMFLNEVNLIVVLFSGVHRRVGDIFPAL